MHKCFWNEQNSLLPWFTRWIPMHYRRRWHDDPAKKKQSTTLNLPCNSIWWSSPLYWATDHYNHLTDFSTAVVASQTISPRHRINKLPSQANSPSNCRLKTYLTTVPTKMQQTSAATAVFTIALVVYTPMSLPTEHSCRFLCRASKAYSSGLRFRLQFFALLLH